MNQQVQITAEQLSAVAAIERQVNALTVEAQQLQNLWKQAGPARALIECAERLKEYHTTFMRDCQRAILIAHEMPNGSGVIKGS